MVESQVSWSCRLCFQIPPTTIPLVLPHKSTHILTCYGGYESSKLLSIKYKYTGGRNVSHVSGSGGGKYVYVCGLVWYSCCREWITQSWLKWPHTWGEQWVAICIQKMLQSSQSTGGVYYYGYKNFATSLSMESESFVYKIDSD